MLLYFVSLETDLLGGQSTELARVFFSFQSPIVNSAIVIVTVIMCPESQVFMLINERHHIKLTDCDDVTESGVNLLGLKQAHMYMYMF